MGKISHSTVDIADSQMSYAHHYYRPVTQTGRMYALYMEVASVEENTPLQTSLQNQWLVREQCQPLLLGITPVKLTDTQGRERWVHTPAKAQRDGVVGREVQVQGGQLEGGGGRKKFLWRGQDHLSPGRLKGDVLE